MNPFFSILSLAYIAGIFLLADSPMVSDVAAFNPYSLLHIPLYGILTFLLILSFSHFKFKVAYRGNPSNPRNPTNPSNPIDPTNPSNPIDPTNPKNSTNPINLSRLPCNLSVQGEMRPALCSVETTTWGSLFHWDSINLLIPGLIALGVAVADEIHQAYIPSRDASIIDVLLDIIGILFFIFLFRRVQSLRWFLKKVEFLCQRTLKR